MTNPIYGGDVFVAPKGTNPLRPAGWSKLGHLISVERTMDTEEYGWLQSTRTNLEVAGDMTIVTDPSKDEGEKPPAPERTVADDIQECIDRMKQARAREKADPSGFWKRTNSAIVDYLTQPTPPSTHWIVDAVKDRTMGPWQHLGWTEGYVDRDKPPAAFANGGYTTPSKPPWRDDLTDCGSGGRPVIKSSVSRRANELLADYLNRPLFTAPTWQKTFDVKLRDVNPEVLKLYYGADVIDHVNNAGESRKKEEQVSNNSDSVTEFNSLYGAKIRVRDTGHNGGGGQATMEVGGGGEKLVKHDDVPLLAHELFAKSAHEKPEQNLGSYVDGDGFGVDILDDVDAADALTSAIANLAAYAEWVRGAEAREEAKRKAEEEKARKEVEEAARKAVEAEEARKAAEAKKPKVGDRVRGKFSGRKGLLVNIDGHTSLGQDAAQVVWDATDTEAQRLQGGVSLQGLEKIGNNPRLP